MNCKHIQELLPLYIGRDLDEKRTQLVTTHVQSCAACAGSVAEYRESRRLLQLFAPPIFSEGVYSGIRQRVLREIDRESSARTLPQLVASLFRPRLRWAASTALLLAVSVSALYFIANRSNDRQQSQVNEFAVEPSASTATAPSIRPNNAPSPIIIGRNSGTGPALEGPGYNNPEPRRRRRSRSLAVGASVAATAPELPSLTAGDAPVPNNLAAPTAVPAQDSATSEKTLRVELQTKDQNIRIIWFSPPPTKQGAPTKSFKHHQEASSHA